LGEEGYLGKVRGKRSLTRREEGGRREVREEKRTTGKRRGKGRETRGRGEREAGQQGGRQRGRREVKEEKRKKEKRRGEGEGKEKRSGKNTCVRYRSPMRLSLDHSENLLSISEKITKTRKKITGTQKTQKLRINVIIIINAYLPKTLRSRPK
jgi:hypothetical protein